MSKRNEFFAQEQQMELLIADSLAHMKPEEAAEMVTPWHKAMRRILVGLALSTISINFYFLNDILLLIGLPLSLFGFRTLRRENRWFAACYGISIARMAYFVIMLILNTTIYQMDFHESSLGYALSLVQIALTLLQFVCLRQSLCAVQKKAGLPLRVRGATALVLWYAALSGLAVLQFGGWIAVIGSAICFIFIIRSMYRIFRALALSGYVLESAKLKIPDWLLAVLLAAVLTVGCTCGYLFFNSYPMQWQPVAESTRENTQIASIKEDLTQLGMPAAVLADMSDEDILRCQNPVEVQLMEYNWDLAVNTAHGDDDREDSAPFERQLHMTSAAIKVNTSPQEWVVIHHFIWQKEVPFTGTEALQLYRSHSGWADVGGLSGRVLYDNNGETYTAAYFFLGEKTYSTTPLSGSTQVDAFAAFSFPNDGQRQRGYLCYQIRQTPEAEASMIDSTVHYTHQNNRRQFPVRTAMQTRKSFGWEDAHTFTGTYSAIQVQADDNERAVQ